MNRSEQSKLKLSYLDKILEFIKLNKTFNIKDLSKHLELSLTLTKRYLKTARDRFGIKLANLTNGDYSIKQ